MASSSRLQFFSRFATNTQFERLQPLLKKLGEHNAKILKAAADLPAASVDEIKSNELTKFLKKIDALVNEFNTKLALPGVEDAADSLKLIQQIKKEILEILEQKYEILNAPRNKNREYTNRAVDIGLKCGAALFGVPSLIKMALSILAVDKASQGVRSFANLTTEEAATVILLKQTLDACIAIEYTLDETVRRSAGLSP